jgi:hypothetical protein
VDDEALLGRIEVRTIQADRFADPHASDSQKGDEGGVGGVAQRPAQVLAGFHERDDVALLVQVRRHP